MNTYYSATWRYDSVLNFYNADTYAKKYGRLMIDPKARTFKFKAGVEQRVHILNSGCTTYITLLTQSKQLRQ